MNAVSRQRSSTEVHYNPFYNGKAADGYLFQSRTFTVVGRHIISEGDGKIPLNLWKRVSKIAFLVRTASVWPKIAHIGWWNPTLLGYVAI